jgi:hypothetical protein
MRKSHHHFRPSHWFLAAALLLSLSATAASADPWSFAVAGDDRTDLKALSPDPTGINTKVLKKLLHAIDEQKPRFMLFTGDLVVGENPRTAAKLAEQFSYWTNIVQTETPNLTVLPVRGNHEIHGDPDGKHWLAAFKPGLDSNNVAYFPGEEGFSYTWSPPGHPEIVIIALDQFIHTHHVNLVELENALKKAQAGHAAHIFVFAHEMAFTCTNHGDSDNMAAFPDERDKFVDLLQSYGCEYFFAGHDHAYDWMSIKHTKWPAGYVLNQIVAGTAGAPFYEDKKYYGDHHGYDLTRLDHKQDTHGYLLVTVDDGPDNKKVTVTFETVTP